MFTKAEKAIKKIDRLASLDFRPIDSDSRYTLLIE